MNFYVTEFLERQTPTVRVIQFLIITLAWPDEPILKELAWKLVPPIIEKIRIIHFRKILKKNT